MFRTSFRSRASSRTKVLGALALVGVLGLFAFWASSATATHEVSPPNFDTLWGGLADSKGIATSLANSGRVYISSASVNEIFEFDANGLFLNRWGGSGNGNGQFNNPHQLAVGPSNNVLVADTNNHRIQKFSPGGNFITKWGSFGNGNGQFNLPQGVVVGTAGNVIVADTGNHRIQKFNFNGNFITKWGSFGSGNGQFNLPRGVALDSAGNVYVADTKNNRIQKFDANGNFITKWGGNGQFSEPYDVAVDNAGNVYVVQIGDSRVQKFAPGLSPLFSHVEGLESDADAIEAKLDALASNVAVQGTVLTALVGEVTGLESKVDILQAELAALRKLDLTVFQSPVLLRDDRNLFSIGATLGGLPVDVTLAEVMAFKVIKGVPVEWIDVTSSTLFGSPIQGQVRMLVVLQTPLTVPDISQFRFIVEHDTGSGIVSGTAFVPNEHFDIQQFLQ